MQIELQPEQMFCRAHLEPFRADWPRGYPSAVPLLFSAFSALPAVIGHCTPDGEPKADIERIGAALNDLGPACCAISEPLLSRIITTCLTDPPDVPAYQQLAADIRASMEND